MNADQLITTDAFCTLYKVEISFVSTLRENGLLEVVQLEEQQYIPLETLPRLERIVRFYYDLEINLEGIEVILHLLDKVEHLQSKVLQLQSQLQHRHSH